MKKFAPNGTMYMYFLNELKRNANTIMAELLPLAGLV